MNEDNRYYIGEFLKEREVPEIVEAHCSLTGDDYEYIRADKINEWLEDADKYLLRNTFEDLGDEDTIREYGTSRVIATIKRK